MWDSNHLYHKLLHSQIHPYSPFDLYDAAKSNKGLLQKLCLQTKLAVHQGCVNTICWNDSGQYILSGSDDQQLCLTHGYTHQNLATIRTGHKANIFSAKFLPNTGDRHVVSCSGDGVIVFTDVERPETSLYNVFKCHYGTAYEVTTVPNDPHTFLSCGEDGTVRWFDLRTKNHCSSKDCKDDILINCRYAVTALAVNHLTPYLLGVGCADSNVRIFDRRMLGTRALGSFAGNGAQSVIARFTVPEFETKSHRITSLCYSPDGQDMLVSYSSDYIYLFNTKDDGRATAAKSCPSIPTPATASSGKTTAKKSAPPEEKPAMRRLRVRGDWSDTGPNARPETERQQSSEESVSVPEDEARPRPIHSSLMQRMSDVLNRIFNAPSRTRSRASEGSDEPQPTSSQNSSQVASSSSHGARPVSAESTPTQEKKQVSFLQKLRASRQSRDSEAVGGAAAVTEENPLASSSNNDTVERKDEEATERNDENHAAACSSSASTSTSEGITETFAQSLQNLEQEIVIRREELIERHNREPLVNLQYSSQGTNSGLITVEPGSVASLSSTNFSGSGSDAHLSDLQSVSLGSVTPRESRIGLSASLDSVAAHSLLPVVPTRELNESSSSASSQQTRLEAVGNEDTLFMEIHPWVESTAGSRSQPNAVGNNEHREFDDEEEALPEPDGRRSRRGMREDEEESDSPINAEANEQEPRRNGRNPRELLLRSFDDVIKHFREERDQEKAYLASVAMPQIKQRYTGHRNARTMIKEATFWGNDYVMSGSDCGHVFVWDRYTGEVVMMFEADHHVVNCLQPHPFDPILATSGIDHDIKLWSPLRMEATFDEAKTAEIIRRNEVMLEETKDTITVPASFMIRMLTSLNHLRANRRGSRSRREAAPEGGEGGGGESGSDSTRRQERGASSSEDESN